MCSVDRMPSFSLTSVRSSSESTMERTEYLGSAFPFSGMISTPSCSFSHPQKIRLTRLFNDIVKVAYYFEPMEFGNRLGDCDAFEHDIITGWFKHMLRLFGFVQDDRFWWWEHFVAARFASFLHRFVCKINVKIRFSLKWCMSGLVKYLGDPIESLFRERQNRWRPYRYKFLDPRTRGVECWESNLY